MAHFKTVLKTNTQGYLQRRWSASSPKQNVAAPISYTAAPTSVSLSLSLNCGGWNMNTGSVCNNMNYPPSCMTFHTHRWLYFIYTSCLLDYFNMPLGFPLDTSLLNIRTFWINNTDIFPYMDFFLTFKIFLILWAFFVLVFIIIIQIFWSCLALPQVSPTSPSTEFYIIFLSTSTFLKNGAKKQETNKQKAPWKPQEWKSKQTHKRPLAKTAQTKQNEAKPSFWKFFILKNTLQSFLCWSVSPGRGVCSGVRLICPVTRHLRKQIFPLVDSFTCRELPDKGGTPRSVLGPHLPSTWAGLIALPPPISVSSSVPQFCCAVWKVLSLHVFLRVCSSARVSGDFHLFLCFETERSSLFSVAVAKHSDPKQPEKKRVHFKPYRTQCIIK